MTYGEYKKQKASTAFDLNFKIPKKTTQEKITNTWVKPSNSKTTETIADDAIENDYGCEDYSPLTTQSDGNVNTHLANQTTENRIVSVDNPMTEGVAITALKELMSSNQLATFVDLIKQMTQNDTLAKMKEALKTAGSIGEGKRRL